MSSNKAKKAGKLPTKPIQIITPEPLVTPAPTATGVDAPAVEKAAANQSQSTFDTDAFFNTEQQDLSASVDSAAPAFHPDTTMITQQLQMMQQIIAMQQEQMQQQLAELEEAKQFMFQKALTMDSMPYTFMRTELDPSNDAARLVPQPETKPTPVSAFPTNVPSLPSQHPEPLRFVQPKIQYAPTIQHGAYIQTSAPATTPAPPPPIQYTPGIQHGPYSPSPALPPPPPYVPAPAPPTPAPYSTAVPHAASTRGVISDTDAVMKARLGLVNGSIVDGNRMYEPPHMTELKMGSRYVIKGGIGLM